MTERSTAGGLDGARPRAVDAQSFRQGMSQVACSVHVVTTSSGAGDAGMTATAVSSVSDSPPTLLACINTTSRVHDLILVNGILAVNTLRASQEELAAHFAGQRGGDMADRFRYARWHRRSTGAPVLDDAVAWFDCVVDSYVEVGSHRVFFARVLEVATPQSDAVLLYAARRYASLNLAS